LRVFIAAYDINDGHLIWKGYNEGGDIDSIINPEKTIIWRDGKLLDLGKNVGMQMDWHSLRWALGLSNLCQYTYDPELNLIYYAVGVANFFSQYRSHRWILSLWARDADTGEVKWVNTIPYSGNWDLDELNQPVLKNQIINGQLRKTLVHFDKQGFSYVLDRVTGESLIAKKFYQPVNLTSHLKIKVKKPLQLEQNSTGFQAMGNKAVDICPASLEAKNPASIVYSPKTQLFYTANRHLCMAYEPADVIYI